MPIKFEEKRNLEHEFLKVYYWSCAKTIYTRFVDCYFNIDQPRKRVFNVRHKDQEKTNWWFVPIDSRNNNRKW